MGRAAPSNVLIEDWLRCPDFALKKIPKYKVCYENYFENNSVGIILEILLYIE